MEPLWRWGADLIIALQLAHTPALDAFFNVITWLGSETFYLLLLPVLYWCIDKSLAQQLACLFLLSVYGNTWLKELFGHPRPFAYDRQVLKLDITPVEELGYGLPSGHSQSAVLVWGYLAASMRRRWMWVLAVVMTVLIAFSRIYLGVHFPSDVVAGLLLGGLWLGVFWWFAPHGLPWLAQQSLWLQSGLALAGPGILLAIHSSGDATAAMGTLMGLGIGIVLERRAVRFSTRGSAWQRGLRLIVGMVVIILLREGLKLVFPAPGETLYVFGRVVRYGLVGLWVALGGPWAFRRLGLTG